MVAIEIEDQNDSLFQASVPFDGKVVVDPTTLKIWKPDCIRLFISHRDQDKEAAKQIAGELEQFGISSFVAHDTIEPFSSWQSEILKGLATMEVMLVFITKGFHESVWCNQEIGYALGRGVPTISLKVDHDDPEGFIAAIQAQRASREDLDTAAGNIYSLITETVGLKSRAQGVLVNEFVKSTDFHETIASFKQMKNIITRLEDQEYEAIEKAIKENSQIHNCEAISRRNQLNDFLYETFLKHKSKTA